MSDLMRALLVVGAAGSIASAGVSIVDGFGDGDRDNDGVLEGAVNDASDTGIQWYGIGGATSGGDPKPGLTVEDDAAGLGSGNALFGQARGGGSELAGFFGQRVSLGQNVGDKMILSFDVRLDTTREPLDELTSSAELRFGLYTDNDGEIGNGGWGTSDGDFDNNNPGVRGDSGFLFRLGIGETQPATPQGRIVYEREDASQILGGSGDETIKVQDDFAGIYDDLAHSIEVTFERIDAAPGEDLLITVTLDGVSFSDTTANENLPMLLDLASFDYFALTTNQDQDWALDNFSLRTVAIPAPGAVGLIGLSGVVVGARRRR
ncbi:MAG: hypothetical protein AAGI53_10440 [Planctomycetota bacterium]